MAKQDWGQGGQLPLLSRYLSTGGDGSGTKNMVANHPTTPVFIRPPATDVFRLSELVVLLEDAAIGGGVYGGLGAALVNGITVVVRRGASVVLDLTDNEAIMTTSHWARLASSMDFVDYQAGTNDLCRFSIKLEDLAGGQEVRLVGRDLDELAVLLNDDFTGLISHTFFAKGFVEKVLEAA